MSRGVTGVAIRSDLLDLPFYHPTLEEGMKPALRAICKAASLDLSNSRDSGNSADAASATNNQPRAAPNGNGPGDRSPGPFGFFALSLATRWRAA